MTAYLIVGGHGAGLATGGGITRYLASPGYMIADPGEGQCQVKGTYTLSKLYGRVIANTLVGATTLRSRKNAANGAQSVPIAPGAVGVFRDLVNSDALALDDLFSTQYVTGAGAGSITFTVAAYLLDGTPILYHSNFAGTTTGFGTFYLPLGGRLKYTTPGGALRSRYVFRTATTLSRMRLNILINTLDGASTLKLFKNGVAGNQIINIGIGETGIKEDAVNTDSLVPGDDAQFQFIGGGGAGVFAAIWYSITSSSLPRQMICGDNSATTLGSGLTRYLTVEGGTDTYATVEANAQVACLTPFIARNLFVRVFSNTLDGATTITLRKNGAPSALTITVPAASGATTVEDLVNSVALVATDLIDIEIVTAGAAGAIGLSLIGFEQLPSAPGPKGSIVPLMVGAGMI